MSEISTLPIWKKEATAYERLSELALLAKEKPEFFHKFAIVYMEEVSKKGWKYRTMDFQCNINDKMALFEVGKIQTYEDSCK